MFTEGAPLIQEALQGTTCRESDWKLETLQLLKMRKHHSCFQIQEKLSWEEREDLAYRILRSSTEAIYRK